MTTDPRIAALAEALTVWQGNRYEYAAAILAALPPDWFEASDGQILMMAHAIRDKDAEIVRLRKIEEAARRVAINCEDVADIEPVAAQSARRLRNALEADR